MRLRFTTRLSEDISRPTHHKTNLKQGAHTQQPTAWSVPHVCAQPYHPGSGSHGQLFRPYWAHQHGIAVIVLSLSRIKMSKIQVNRQWRQSACNLRGRPLKGKGKEIPSARDAQKARKERKRNLPSSRSSVPLKILLINWLFKKWIC